MQYLRNDYRIITTLIICVLLLISQAKAAESPSTVDIPMLNFTLGQVGVLDDIDDPFRVGIEYRMRSFSRWKLIPAIGYAHAENGANFLYSDLRHDFWLNDKWILIPSFGVGTFEDSEEIQLGHEIQFRSGIEIAYRFHDQYRIGLAIFHLSNAGLSEKNPGTESLVLSLCIPLEN